ncbi:hypothetical protein VNI00_015063 [Paramarasmius palmivorus]|uniref:NmrA-like domain-containing protein n=1 Tax=Paramarasmius palmivorus TaxID=297713 RepID=A0AAW0BN67_9AGAR
MPQSYKSFAIVGAGGYIGTFILNAFVAGGYKPLIVSRKLSSYSPPASLSAPFVKVDLENVNEVSAVLREHRIEVLISLVGTDGISSQRVLADAAKKSGVKLFVPSEFGFVSEGISKIAVEDQRTPQAEKDRLIGLVGAFFQWMNWLTGYDENGKINILGKGETPVGLTHEEDIGGFVAYTLTTLTPAQLHSRSFRIEGDTVTLAEIAKRLDKEVVFVDRLPGGPHNEAKNQIGWLAEAGKGSSRWDYAISGLQDALDNDLWQGHVWKKFTSMM